MPLPRRGTFAPFLKRTGAAGQCSAKPLSPVYVTAGFRVQWYEFGRLQQALDDETIAAAPVGLELALARTALTSRESMATDCPASTPGGSAALRATARSRKRLGRSRPSASSSPRFSIDAKIERVGVTEWRHGRAQGSMECWLVCRLLPARRERTNVTMSGHRDWWGIGPTVFWNLEQLAPGDKIYLIGKDGRGATYVVTETWQVDANTDAGTVIGDVGL
ncbi:MAG: hypothetical protein KatS3mg059_1086 [Thermomicrobiales bacterium]|nr:MAG: hypothetical protein KatS3mg059_1086 [Thermomicrobiales bacterium]